MKLSNLKMRQELKNKIDLLPNSSKLFFNQLYSSKDIDKDINLTIDSMSNKQIKVAICQVNNTLVKFNINYDEHAVCSEYSAADIYLF